MSGIPEPRRLLFVSYEYPPLGGGGGVVVRDLAQALAERLEVTVLTSRREGLPEREREAGVDLVRVPVWLRRADAVASLPSMLSFFPSSLRVGRRLLRERRFDLVHSFFAVPSAPSGLLLARAAGLPHVLSIMGGDAYDPSKRLSPHRTPLLKQTVATMMRRSQRVIAVSEDLASRSEQYFGATGIERVPNAVRPQPCAAPDRALLGLDPEAFVLVTVGRLVARKGLDDLLAVLARLDVPSAQLLVIGDGPLREPLQQRAEALGVAERVRFTGFVEEERKWQLLAASDLYVSTTLHEGFGLVYLEAMWSGLPVLTYDCGGQTDFLTSDFATLVPAGDAERFAVELEALRVDPERRRRMGDEGRRVATRHGVDRLAERHLAIYRELLSGG